MTTPAADLTPRWLKDFERLLPIRSQFIVSGNIRDTVLSPVGQTLVPVPLLRGLWEKLKAQEFRYLLIYDPADGIRVYPNEPAVVELATKVHELKLQDGVMPMGLESLVTLMRKLTASRDAHAALILDFASRLARAPDHLDAGEHRFFVAAEKLALSASPVIPTGAASQPLFNPILWLVNRPQDLPSWFALDSERIASLIVGRPDYETREAAARQLIRLFPGYKEAEVAQQAEAVRRYADGTDGLTLTALADIAQLAMRQGITVCGVEDAVRSYKVGATDNPWRKDYLKDKIRNARATLEDRVKGQHQAATKTVDILMRSVMGLTGAQARSGGGRPRGVLFFAGPTGVGKTELAKTLTQLMFGDERAYIRFDMSEFAEEHTGARLLGAPPGYIGYDAGGELTDAVKERPFAVILFDEIEKAHPDVIQLLLQALEDGRLTDSLGRVVDFRNTIIILTSNVGADVLQRNNSVGFDVGVDSTRDYEKLKERIMDETKRAFKPEFLNRLTDIVIFQQLAKVHMTKIVDIEVDKVAKRLLDLGVKLVVNEAARGYLVDNGWDEKYGARPLRRAVERLLEDPLAESILRDDYNKDEPVIVSVGEKGLVFTQKKSGADTGA